MPLFIGYVVSAIEKGDFDSVGLICIELFIIVFVCGIFVGLRAFNFNTMSERIARELRKDFYESVINKDVEFFENNRTGDLLSRLNSDTSVVQDSLSTNVSMFLRSFVSIVSTIIICFVLSPILAITMFVGIIPIIVFSVKFADVMRGVGKKI